MFTETTQLDLLFLRHLLAKDIVSAKATDTCLCYTYSQSIWEGCLVTCRSALFPPVLLYIIAINSIGFDGDERTDIWPQQRSSCFQTLARLKNRYSLEFSFHSLSSGQSSHRDLTAYPEQSKPLNNINNHNHVSTNTVSTDNNIHIRSCFILIWHREVHFISALRLLRSNWSQASCLTCQRGPAWMWMVVFLSHSTVTSTSGMCTMVK